MSKNTKKDYWEENNEDEQPEKYYLTQMELMDVIEDRLEKQHSPAEFARKETNSLISEYNFRFGYKYAKI